MNFRLFFGLAVGIAAFTLFLLWANTAHSERYPAAAPFGNAMYIALSVPARKPAPPCSRVVVFIYLISYPCALSAAETLSIASFASASVSVFSNDWKITRYASDTFPSFSNLSNSEIFNARGAASFFIVCCTFCLFVGDVHIAISRTIYGYLENGSNRTALERGKVSYAAASTGSGAFSEAFCFSETVPSITRSLPPFHTVPSSNSFTSVSPSRSLLGLFFASASVRPGRRLSRKYGRTESALLSTIRSPLSAKTLVNTSEIGRASCR